LTKRRRDHYIPSSHNETAKARRVLDAAGAREQPEVVPTLLMRNLTFGFFDDSLPRDSRILMFYSFETDERLPRSGILHYHVGEGRFVGPRHDNELLQAALEFLTAAGRVPGAHS
jgi:hypothetical protein